MGEKPKRRRPRTASDALDATAATFVSGVLRLFEAQIAYYRTSAALHALNAPVKSIPANVDARHDALERISGITFRQYDAYRYLTELSYLTYLTTLLDTFLTDVTTILLLSFPQAIGADRKVDLKLVLGAQSRSQVINQAAQKRTRELSYLSLVDRIAFLDQTFGLQLRFNDEDKRILEHCADLRNTATHDQGVFEFYLDPRGKLQVRQKRCQRHPTPIRSADLEEAERAYKRTVASLYEAIATKVFDSTGRESFNELFGALDSKPKEFGASKRSRRPRQKGHRVSPGTKIKDE